MMKIRRYRSTPGTSPFTVTGPGFSEKTCPSVGSAYAVALDRASRTGETFYVREYGDIIAWAEGHSEDGLRAVLVLSN